jgi:Asp-tRNA(Asn)/Glu-tRNA(Gln) amidotransferase C subunit
VEDVDESSWIKVNIVDKNLTWKEAQEAFTKHFEIYSYSAQLVKDYEHIKQYTKQSVQEYSHKFNRLCIELGYDESNPLVIQHYLNGLIPERHASYKKQMAIVKLTTGNVSMFTSSLEEVIKLTSELEIADLNSQVQHNYHTDNKSQSLNNTYSTQVKKKVCANHPNSSTHTTAECSLTKTGSKSHTTNNTSATNSTNNNTTKPQNNYNNSEGAKKKPVKCHVCGGPHYANDPICPKHYYT